MLINGNQKNQVFVNQVKIKSETINFITHLKEILSVQKSIFMINFFYQLDVFPQNLW